MLQIQISDHYQMSVEQQIFFSLECSNSISSVYWLVYCMLTCR